MPRATLWIDRGDVRRQDKGFAAPNTRLKSYLAGSQEDNMSMQPIADLCPHCTVLFADISGFTPLTARMSALGKYEREREGEREEEEGRKRAERGIVLLAHRVKRGS